MMTLYKLSNMYEQAFELLGNEEIPEETILNTIESLDGDIKCKMTNVSAFFLNLEAQAEAIAEAAKRMKERELAARRRVEFLKNYLKTHMEKCGITEISSPEFVVKLGNCPPAVIIDDLDEVPAIYKIAKTTYAPDKAAIKEAIKNDEVVPGAHLESSKRLIIK